MELNNEKLLDQALFELESKAYLQFVALLDAPRKSNPGLERYGDGAAVVSESIFGRRNNGFWRRFFWTRTVMPKNASETRVHDEAIEAWLETEVTEIYDHLKANPQDARTLAQVKQRLAEEFRRYSAS